MSRQVRTRFAPSPTGFLHVGGVRTALFAWLVARQAAGQFILRIEDTDKTREIEGSEQHIMDSLRWLDLQWDEGPDGKGGKGPYRQSERLDIYQQWAEKLIKAGRAYADPYAPEQLEELRTQAKDNKKPFLFRDFRPDKPPEWKSGLPLRFKSEPKSYRWKDEVMGELSSGPEVIDDFILIKSDGYPTYNFAHIIDDHLMEVSHVIRSQEFLASVPKFLNLYEALGIPVPKMATLPYVMGPDGRKKLSKRDGAKDILDYQKEGYLPEALVNFLATLGWNDGSEQEIFSIDEPKNKFSLSRVGRSGASFDEKRLSWMNGHYIRELSIEELYKRADNFWSSKAQEADENYKKAVLELVQERLKYLSELPQLTDFFFVEPRGTEVADLYRKPPDKQLKKDGSVDLYKRLLTAAIESLQASIFELDDIKTRLSDILEEENTKPAIFFPIIRIAVSGKPASPELSGTLHVLGKEKSLGRLKSALAELEK